MSEHTNGAHTEPKNVAIKGSFPKSFFIIIILVIGAMLYYSSITRPENAILNYFSSLTNQDYHTTAESLSVFVMAMQLNQYASPGVTGKELLEQRAEIVEAYSAHIADNSFDTYTYLVEPNNSHTKIGLVSAIVIFDLTYEEKNPTCIAYLIKEANRFRIIDIAEINFDTAFREELERFNIDELDKEFASYFE